jgi:hypothetical protein
MRYDVSLDYNKNGGLELDSSPSWCLAIFRLARPVSYSRKERASIGPVIAGGMLRKEAPFIITSECVHMSVSGSKTSCVKTLNCSLKGTTNYLSANTVLNGDWIMGWMHTNPNDTNRIVKALQKGQPANDFRSGLKFIGRVHSIRKRRSTVSSTGIKTVNYSLQAVGFDELSTIFFYDPALASLASAKDIWHFMAEIGVNTFQFLSEAHINAGIIKDNAENFFDRFLDIVVGEGSKSSIDAGQDLGGTKLSAQPQQNKEAPYSYLIPLSVATTLGRTSADERKGTNNGHSAYGYADILTTVTGVQKYQQEDPAPKHRGFVPIISGVNSIDSHTLDFTSHANRLRCPERIKGTYIPIEPVFINTPLWDILNQFKNPTVNEMYTCIRPNLAGELMPTIVFRQIPFSSESIEEKGEMALTRFMSLPRWVIPGSITIDEDIGRSNATHFNFIHVYGQVAPFQQKREYSITDQMTRNAPIMDVVNVASHGFKPYMSTVACSITDILRKDGARVWMEAIADWTIGSEHTLNGTVNCKGIQSPIAEGDNVEIDEVAYHVESISHTCGVAGEHKYFNTSLTLTNGMPVDQSTASENAPHYAGFVAEPEFNTLGEDMGDDSFNTANNPGTVADSD